MNGSAPLQVLIVDDHPLIRHGLAIALQQESNIEVVATAASALEAVELAAQHAIDVAIIDILMPDVSGITLATELHELLPNCRVLGLSVIDEPGLIADMFRAHACGFVLKTQPIAEIVEAIHHVLDGSRYLPPGMPAAAIDDELRGTPGHPFERLTKRERQVFELLIRGYSNDEIAIRLIIARRTVETHRQRITNKLSAHSVLQLQRLAARHGGL